jgi:hypothetical protein
VVVAVARPRFAWSLVIGAAAAIAITSAIAIAVVGVEPFSSYARITTTSSTVLTADPFAFGFLNLGMRLFTTNPWAHSIVAVNPGVVRDAFALLVVAMLGGLLVLLRRRSPSDAQVWAIALLAPAICSPFLEAPHLAPLTLIPWLLLFDGTVGRRTLVAIVAVALGCSTAALVLAHHPAEGLSALAIIATTVWVRRRGTFIEAALAGAFVLLSTPSFDAISSFWPSPLSVLKVLLGSAELVAVLIVLGCAVAAVLTRSVTAVVERPAVPEVADLDYQVA